MERNATSVVSSKTVCKQVERTGFTCMLVSFLSLNITKLSYLKRTHLLISVIEFYLSRIRGFGVLFIL